MAWAQRHIVAYHEGHGVSFRRQINCVLIENELSKLRIIGLLWEHSTGDPRSPLTKDQ